MVVKLPDSRRWPRLWLRSVFSIRRASVVIKLPPLHFRGGVGSTGIASPPPTTMASSCSRLLASATFFPLINKEPLARKLGINDAQKKDLRESEQKIEEELANQIAELRNKARKKLLSKLSKAQQDKLEKILGDDFEFRKPSGGKKPRRVKPKASR